MYCSTKHKLISFLHRTDSDNRPKGYDIFGGACIEVEIDVLTGQFVVSHRKVTASVLYFFLYFFSSVAGVILHKCFYFSCSVYTAVCSLWCSMLTIL